MMKNTQRIKGKYLAQLGACENCLEVFIIYIQKDQMKRRSNDPTFTVRDFAPVKCPVCSHAVDPLEAIGLYLETQR